MTPPTPAVSCRLGRRARQCHPGFGGHCPQYELLERDWARELTTALAHNTHRWRSSVAACTYPLLHTTSTLIAVLPYARALPARPPPTVIDRTHWAPTAHAHTASNARAAASSCRLPMAPPTAAFSAPMTAPSRPEAGLLLPCAFSLGGDLGPARQLGGLLSGTLHWDCCKQAGALLSTTCSARAPAVPGDPV